MTRYDMVRDGVDGDERSASCWEDASRGRHEQNHSPHHSTHSTGPTEKEISRFELGWPNPADEERRKMGLFGASGRNGWSSWSVLRPARVRIQSIHVMGAQGLSFLVLA